MAIEFVAPDFIEGCSPEEIQDRMMANLPKDIDDMPGGFPYDFTMPTALEKSETIQFHMVRVLMLMFPQFAWGEWLDYHGKQANVTRRAGRRAEGKLRIEGNIGLEIPKGTIFCTAATDENSSVLFATDEEGVIEEGAVDIHITAVDAGKESNVIAGTVILAENPINGITSITNPKALTGGTDDEDDETYRARILEAYALETMNVGNNGDYVRWAKEVAGVGSVSVIPEWDGPGTVKLVIIDTNGDPAGTDICTEVYNHIMQPDSPMERKAPIGAALTVVSPDITKLNYVCTVKLVDGANIDEVKDNFKKNLSEYYLTAEAEGILKFARICSALINTEGIYDFSEITVNGKTGNVELPKNQFPVTESISMTEVEGAI